MSYTMIAAIFLCIGIYAGKGLGVFNLLLITLPVVTVSFVCILFRKEKSAVIFIAFLMLFIGGVSYSVADYDKLYDTFPEKYVTVTGVIVSHDMEKGEGEGHKYTVKTEEASYLGKTVKPDKRMYVWTKEPYEYGDIIKFSGFLRQISGGENQYDYDYSLSAKSKGIYNRITAYEEENKDNVNVYSLKYGMGKLRNTIYELIHSKFEGDTAEVYTAIVLGDKSGISDSYVIKLMRTGLWQSLYSPYIHILLMSLIAGMFRSSRKKNSALLTFLLAYALLNIGIPNSVKASLLLAAVIACRKIFGYSDKMEQLSALVIVMLLTNPMLCYSRAFVMSVSCTIVLFLFYPAFNKMILGIFSKLKIKSRFLISTMSIFVTLLVCGTPICAYLFNGVAVFATLITTAMIPVVGLIIVLSVIYFPCLLAGFEAKWLGDFIGKILEFLQSIPDYIEKVPFHYITMPTPKLLELITVYLILWLVAQLILNRKRDDIFRAVSAVTLAFMICSVFFSQSAGLEVYFVNVGQGDSAILHTFDNKTILVDGGGAAEYSTSDYNVGDRVVVPYMISHGFSRVDYAVVTHFHKDHAEGIVSAVKNLKVRNLIMPDCSPENEYRIELERIASEKGINIIYAKKDGLVSFSSGLTLKFLAPDERQLAEEDSNGNSIVMAVEYGDFVGLFTGDSDDVVDDSYPENVDLLKVSHHGSATASSKKDIERINPKYAVISVGKNNSYGLPSDEVVENLEKAGAEILRTDLHGDIRFKVRKNGKITYKTLRKE